MHDRADPPTAWLAGTASQATVTRPDTLFELEGPLCAACALRGPCGAALSPLACQLLEPEALADGGRDLHPWTPGFIGAFQAIGGPEFSDVVATRSRQERLLPAFLPGVRFRRALSGKLGTAAALTVRVGDVLLSSRVRPAAEFREMLELDSRQAVILLLFGSDEALERLWQEQGRLLPAIAASGYDAVVAPSFSLWVPGTRPNHLYALKRSLWMFGRLEQLGTSVVVPRLAWAVSHDVMRWSDWAIRNRHLETVALDLTTYRSPDDCREQLQFLSEFDRLTGYRLRYLVNGPSCAARYRAVQTVTARDRVSFTNATLAGSPVPRGTPAHTYSKLPPSAWIAAHEYAIAGSRPQCDLRAM